MSIEDLHAQIVAKSATSIPAWLIEWGPIIAGLLALFVPTYYSLAQGLWTNSDQAHGPIVILVVIYLAWQQRQYLLPSNTAISRSDQLIGWISLILGLIFYLIGRSQDIVTLDIGSQVFVLSAVLLIIRGHAALKAMWFPLFFLLFTIPLPGFLIDAVTLPMKIAVSYVAENVLYLLDFPVARSGVVLQIGPYQLLVADACAGMHTLISLEALGLLYLNLVKHDSLLRNVVLATLIVPISFTANVIRVMVLTLVTYYYGDEAGQGFIHGFAGIVLFVVALSLIMAVDSGLQYLVKMRQSPKVAI